MPPQDEFRCDVAYFEERVLVGVHGDLDLATAGALEAQVVAALSLPIREVVVDLAYCPFMDSSGLHALLSIRRFAATKDIAFKLTAVPRQVRTVIDLGDLASELGLS